MRMVAKKLGDCLNIDDLRRVARRRIPSPFFHHLDGGAEAEYTMRRNTSAFDEVRLLPRGLVDVSSVNTKARLFNRDVALPFYCSPTGASRLYHPDGELAVARAANACGVFYGLSTMSTYSLEDVATACKGPKLFQLYIFRERDITSELIERCRTAGYDALCLTIDAPVRGNREREVRAGAGVPLRPSFANALSLISHPRWLAGQVSHGRMEIPNVAAKTGERSIVANSRYVAKQLDPSVTWKDVRPMVEQWRGPFVIKGVMTVDDARRAVEAGATAVVVSNHGGRQLDGAAAAIEVLPEIVRAVGKDVEVVLDGGIRRGVHILKALALGASACSVGRPYLYGLAAGGEAGVLRALEILKSELVCAMRLSGCTSVNDITRDVLADEALRRWDQDSRSVNRVGGSLGLTQSLESRST